MIALFLTTLLINLKGSLKKTRPLAKLNPIMTSIESPLSSHREGSDICRVCRGEGTKDQPLFYPCLCSGSIKYIHQECLLEWLKHSKKRYCELCKHPFRFTPVYQEQMPERLPASVILFGIGSQVFRLVSFAFRYLYLGFIWIFFMPMSTTACFSLFMGWRMDGLLTGNPISIFGSVIFGLVTTAAMLLLMLGLLLLRDYMLTHRLLRIRRRRNRDRGIGQQVVGNVTEALATPGVESEQVNSGGEAEVDGYQPDETNISEVATQITSRTERSTWLNNITPREYRAYRRRKELHRERLERHSSDQAITRTISSRLTDYPGDNTHSPSLGDEEQSMLESASASNLASVASSNVNASLTCPPTGLFLENDASPDFSGLNPGQKSHTKEPGHVDPTFTESTSGPSSNVTSRDNIRCRICHSVVCISREHVVQSSQRNREFDDQIIQTTIPSATLQRENQHSDLPNRPFQGTQPQMRPAPPAFEDEEQPWILFGLNMDGDNNGGLTLSEFLGITGPIYSVLQNAFVIISCNFMVMHAVLFIPHIVGRAVLKGQIPNWLAFTISFIESFFPARVLNSRVIRLGYLKQIIAYLINGSHQHLYSFFQVLPVAIKNWLLKIFETARLFGILFKVSKDSFADFTLQIICGYLVTISICFAYKHLVIDRQRKVVGVNHSILQLFLFLGSFLKLLTVFIIELVMFPIYCGWVIDISCLPLLNGSLAGRIGFFDTNPVLSQILHWTIGTIALVQIAYFVKWLRGIVRPGLLYFIRNSEDPDNLPMKEIVEKPFIKQFLRFINSMIFYGILLSLHLGGFSYLCIKLVPNLFPLNFDFNAQLIDIPLDTFANFIAKILVDSLNVGIVGSFAAGYMRFLSKLLKLSSYFYGGRYLSEESISSGRWVFVPDFDRIYKADKVQSMFNRTVEPLDLAKLPIIEGEDPKRPEDTPGTPTGQATNDIPEAPSRNTSLPPEPRRPRRFVAPSIRRNDASTKGFTVVYRPNYFKMRIALYLLGMVSLFQFFALMVFVIPILLGRSFFELIYQEGQRVHEIHSLQIGSLLVAILIKSLLSIYRFFTSSERAKFKTVFIHFPVRFMQCVLVFFTVTLIWPLLVGTCLLLILLPLGFSVNETPVLPIVSCYSLGEMYMVVFFLMRDIICSAERQRIMDKLVTKEGWFEMRFGEVFLNFLVPYSIRLLIFLIGPPVAVLYIGSLLRLNNDQLLILQRWAYLLSIAGPAIAVCTGLLLNLKRKLANRIRDERYLVGRQLINLEHRPNSTS